MPQLLIAAARLQQALTQILRIALDETLKAEAGDAGLKALLARAGGAADFAALERRPFRPLQDAVRAIFRPADGGP